MTDESGEQPDQAHPLWGERVEAHAAPPSSAAPQPTPPAEAGEPAPARATEPASAAVVAAAPRSRRGALAVSIALAVVAAGIAVALVLTALSLSDDNALEGARTSALATARTYAVELAGYDYRHLQQDFGVVLSHSTASFSKSFRQSSSALEPTLVKYHATATAKVVAAGVVSAATGQVVVLVLVDQTVTNSTQKAPTTDRSQIEMTLVASGGGWLIGQVTLL